MTKSSSYRLFMVGYLIKVTERLILAINYLVLCLPDFSSHSFLNVLSRDIYYRTIDLINIIFGNKVGISMSIFSY